MPTSLANIKHLLGSTSVLDTRDKVTNWLMQCLEVPAMCRVLSAKSILKPHCVPSTVTAAGNKDGPAS